MNQRFESALIKDSTFYKRVLKLLKSHQFLAFDVERCNNFLKKPMSLLPFSLTLINFMVYIGFISVSFDNIIRLIMKTMASMALLFWCLGCLSLSSIYQQVRMNIIFE